MGIGKADYIFLKERYNKTNEAAENKIKELQQAQSKSSDGSIILDAKSVLSLVKTLSSLQESHTTLMRQTCSLGRDLKDLKNKTKSTTQSTVEGKSTTQVHTSPKIETESELEDKSDQLAPTQPINRVPTVLLFSNIHNVNDKIDEQNNTNEKSGSNLSDLSMPGSVNNSFSDNTDLGTHDELAKIGITEEITKSVKDINSNNLNKENHKNEEKKDEDEEDVDLDAEEFDCTQAELEKLEEDNANSQIPCDEKPQFYGGDYDTEYDDSVEIENKELEEQDEEFSLPETGQKIVGSKRKRSSANSNNNFNTKKVANPTSFPSSTFDSQLSGSSQRRALGRFETLRKSGLRIGLVLLCNGIGMAQWAIRNLGWEEYIILTCQIEIETKRRACAKKNFPTWCYTEEKIEKNSMEYFDRQPVKNVFEELKKANCNYIILIGGPPCTPFSDAGLGRGANDIRSDVMGYVARALAVLSECIKEDGNKIVLAYIIENVVPHKNLNHVNFMIEHFHSKPHYIQSGFLSMTQRSRLYFTNFPIEPLPTELCDRRKEINKCLECNVISNLNLNGKWIEVKSKTQVLINISMGEYHGEAIRVKPIIKNQFGYYNMAKICPHHSESDKKNNQVCNHACTSTELSTNLDTYSTNHGGSKESLNAVWCIGQDNKGDDYEYYRGLTLKEKLNFMHLAKLKYSRPMTLSDAAESAGDGFDIPTMEHILYSMSRATNLLEYNHRDLKPGSSDKLRTQFEYEYKNQSNNFKQLLKKQRLLNRA